MFLAALWRRRARFAILLWCLCMGCTSASGLVDDEPPAVVCPAPGPGVLIGGSGDVSADPRTPARIVVLMGGSSEDDSASRRFVEAAGGGDVLVLRATGSVTSYPDYFTLTLDPNPAPASAITALTSPASVGAAPSVLCRVAQAEAIWLAGGSQWDYLGLRPAELHDSLAAATARGVALGGTSAGAVSLGEGTFVAENGTVTSAEALNDPTSEAVSVSLSPFPQPELEGALVDSHFSERNREGRLLAFLARFLELSGRERVLGIGLDERIALVIQGGGYEVLGPADRAAHLYELDSPVTLIPGQPLDLALVRKISLGPGSSGPWPVDFTTEDPVNLEVQDGAVSDVVPNRAPGPSAP